MSQKLWLKQITKNKKNKKRQRFLFYKILKYKKYHKSKIKGKEFRKKFINLKFGFIAIKIIENSRITLYQIEALRKTLIRKIKKKGKIWIRIIPDYPITTIPLGTRMGRGKGNVLTWIYKAINGQICLEISNLNNFFFFQITKFLKSAQRKLPFKSKIIWRNYINLY